MKTNINKLIVTIALCFIGFIGFISASAHAAPDIYQRQMDLRLHQSQQKLDQAKAATGSERQTLMAEHMKLMQKCMDDMNAIKPSANMTTEDTEAWVKICRRQMSQLLTQMKEDSKLTTTNCDPKGK